MNLFIRILCYVAIVVSVIFLSFYRSGFLDSLVVSAVLTLTSFLSGANIFYGKGWDDAYSRRRRSK